MSSMMPMMMMMMVGMACCSSIAAGGAFMYMNPDLMGTGTPAPGPVDPATGVTIKVKSKSKGKYPSGNAAKNKVAADLGDNGIFYIQAVSGSYTYMWAKRGGAGKRCDNFGYMHADTGTTSSGAADAPWAKWRFVKSTTSGSKKNPQYFIYNMGRFANHCKEVILVVEDVVNCAGTPNGVLKFDVEANKADSMTWVAWRDGDSIVFENQACKSIVGTRYLLLDTSINSQNRSASLADWTNATRFKMTKVA